MKNFHDLHFSGFYNHYILGDRSESFEPCFDELLYLVKLLNRWHAHECVCRRINTDLNVVELGESNPHVLILLFFVMSSIKWLTGVEFWLLETEEGHWMLGTGVSSES